MPLDPELNFDWPMPALSDVADLPLAFRRWADALADDMTTSGRLTYTPTWQTVPGTAFAGSPTNQPGGTVQRFGSYSVEKMSGICHITIRLSFSTGVYGAYGGLRIGLPAPAGSDSYQQIMPCLLYTPSTGTVWQGQAIIDTSADYCRPHFPISNARAAEMLPWTSTASVYTNTSIPIVNPSNPGGSCIEPGGYIVVSGSYRFA